MTSLSSQTWRQSSSCLTRESSFFFPVTLDQYRQAKQTCSTCPVRQPCLDFALSGGMDHGVWGGYDEMERQRIKAGLPIKPRNSNQSFYSVAQLIDDARELYQLKGDKLTPEDLDRGNDGGYCASYRTYIRRIPRLAHTLQSLGIGFTHSRVTVKQRLVQQLVPVLLAKGSRLTVPDIRAAHRQGACSHLRMFIDYVGGIARINEAIIAAAGLPPDWGFEPWIRPLRQLYAQKRAPLRNSDLLDLHQRGVIPHPQAYRRQLGTLEVVLPKLGIPYVNAHTKKAKRLASGSV